MSQKRKTYPIKKIGLLLLVLIFFANECRSEDTTFFIHHLKPFSYEENGEFKGFAIDIVREMAKAEGQTVNFMTVPFKRGLREVQRRKNQALLVVAQRPERQDTVRWVGPLISSSVYFYKKKGAVLNIKSLNDIRDNLTVGVALGNADHTYLKKQGFENLVVAYSQVKSIKLLLKGRFDVTPASDIVMYFAIKELRAKQEEIEKTDIKLYDSTLYITLSMDTPEETIVMWQRSLNAIKKSGRYQKIYELYFQ